MAPVDVKRATDVYGQGWTMRQIGAELSVTATTASQQFVVPASPCVAAPLLILLDTTDRGAS